MEERRNGEWRPPWSFLSLLQHGEVDGEVDGEAEMRCDNDEIVIAC